MSRGHCDALCGIRNAVFVLHMQEKESDFNQEENLVWLSYSPRSCGPNSFWSFVLRQLQDSAKITLPTQKKQQKTEINMTYECNSETVGPGGTYNHSAGFLSLLRSFFSLGSTVTFKNWSYSSAETLASDSKPHCDHQSNVNTKLSKFICALEIFMKEGFHLAGLSEREHLRFLSWAFRLF